MEVGLPLDNKSPLEYKLRKSLYRLTYDFNNLTGNEKLGVAVSGGADSVALLTGLISLLKDYPIKIYVITVNHNIRREEETKGDALFVKDLCDKFTKKVCQVNCDIVEIERGEVTRVAREHKQGIEEAARYLRYQAFDQFIDKYDLDYLCLAHNLNDHMETILMRFLQGSNCDALKGIAEKRGKYVRPLLNVSRDEITEYLNRLNISWHEDITNQDTHYFRNNIRHNLIPYLNENFEGWQKGLCKVAEKAEEDSKAIKNIVDTFPLSINKGVININIDEFSKLCIAIQKRIILKAYNLLGGTERVPEGFLLDLLKSIPLNKDNSYFKIFGSIKIEVKKGNILVYKNTKNDTDLIFFDIIKEDGFYSFPFGNLSVTKKPSYMLLSINGNEIKLNCEYPFVIRNAKQGDEILNSNGVMQKVSDIFASWHVDLELRSLIPIIYEVEEGPKNLLAIIASFLDYKDWIVK